MGREFIRHKIELPMSANQNGVILFDGYEDFFNWVGSGNTGDWLVEQSTTKAYNGNKSLYMRTRVTGPAENDWVDVIRTCQQRPSGRYQIELFFRIESVATWKGFRVYAMIWDGTLKHSIFMSYNKQGNYWEYWTAAGPWEIIAGSGQNLLDGIWHRVAIQFDQNSKTIRELVCNRMELKNLGLSYYTEAFPSAEEMRVGIIIWNMGASAIEGYLDDVLLLEV